MNRFIVGVIAVLVFLGIIVLVVRNRPRIFNLPRLSTVQTTPTSTPTTGTPAPSGIFYPTPTSMPATGGELPATGF